MHVFAFVNAHGLLILGSDTRTYEEALQIVLHAPANCCSQTSRVLEKLLVSLVKERAACNKLVITRMRGVWQYWLKARTRDLVAETLVFDLSLFNEDLGAYSLHIK